MNSKLKLLVVDTINVAVESVLQLMQNRLEWLDLNHLNGGHGSNVMRVEKNLTDEKNR
tara:strand:- start:363 stop:536 length:174 start_codon:yes stop_codon:yes gene_type:complete